MDLSNPMALEGRTFLVTGGAQGIGLSVARQIQALGGATLLIDVNQAALDATRSVLNAEKTLTLAGSVTDEAFMNDAVVQGVNRFGAMHGLVNNAGIVRAAMIEKMTMDQWRQVIDVNLTGAFVALQAVGRHLLKRAAAGEKRVGSIVNVSSDAGRRGTMGQINYGAAKAGLFGLTMSAAREWAKHDIRVNTICFGLVETDMTAVIRSEKFRAQSLAKIPMARWGGADEAAKPICYLLSEAADLVTGQTFSMNGGSHMQV